MELSSVRQLGRQRGDDKSLGTSQQLHAQWLADRMAAQHPLKIVWRTNRRLSSLDDEVAYTQPSFRRGRVGYHLNDTNARGSLDPMVYGEPSVDSGCLP